MVALSLGAVAQQLLIRHSRMVLAGIQKFISRNVAGSPTKTFGDDGVGNFGMAAWVIRGWRIEM